MINEALKTAVMGDIVLLSLIGIKVVLVHGRRAGDNRHAEKSREEDRVL